MADLRFTWDPAKAKVNAAKHGVSFTEAQTVFLDDRARLIDDPEHSQNEARFVLLGLSVRLRVLVVVHAYREAAGSIRLISARRASTRADSTSRVSHDEEGIRLQQGTADPLRGTAQAGGHDSPGRIDDRLLQGFGDGDGHRPPDPDQLVFEGLCRVEAATQREVGDQVERGCLTFDGAYRPFSG